MRKVGSGFLVLLALCGSASAQSRAAMERCRAILDPERRLACYDAIDLAISPPRAKYEVVELSELKQFALSYRGDLVEVSGWVTPGNELLTLGGDEADTDTIPIEFESLSRQDRRNFLTACGEGCRATVQGRVMPVNFTTGIVADALFLN
jgi:hypothetical protein